MIPSSKIIGRAQEVDPASEVDLELRHVSLLHRAKASDSTFTTLPSSSDEGDHDGSDRDGERGAMEDTTPAEDNNDIQNRNSPLIDDSVKHRRKVKVDCAGLCPFREYRYLAKSAPRGSVTLLTLTAMLQPLGCNGCQIGSIMFELDTNGVGYRIWDDAFEAHAHDVIQRNTSLDVETIATALNHYRAVHHRARHFDASCTAKGVLAKQPILSVSPLRSIASWFRAHRTDNSLTTR